MTGYFGIFRSSDQSKSIPITERVLRSLDIQILRDLAVGENLQDHPHAPFFFSSLKSTSPAFNPLRGLQGVYQYLTKRTGELAALGTLETMGFVNKLNTDEPPDIQYMTYTFERQNPMLFMMMQYLDYDKELIRSVLEVNTKEQVSAVFVVLLRPKSRGSVTVKSSDPHESPRYVSGYLEEADDVATIVRGIRAFKRLLETEAFKSIEAKEVRVCNAKCDELKYDTDQYWELYVRHYCSSVFHYSGTCKMGPDTDPKAVVDAELRVRGIEGLRVIDASIMPQIVSGNTNAATMMIGEKGADFIKMEYGEL